MDFPVSSEHSINQLPLVAHAKLWNDQGKEKYVKELKPHTYKSQSKQSILGSYLALMTPDQQDIAMQSMKKAKHDDKENIPNEEEEGNVKIQGDSVDRPEEEQSHITQEEQN